MQKALELDGTLAEAHASFGRILCYDYYFDRSVTELARAIELDPNNAMARHWFSSGPLMGQADFDRAIAEGKRSIELDPLSLINNADLGWVYCSARRYDDAIVEYAKAAELDDDPVVLALLGQAYGRNGREDEARTILARLSEQSQSRYVSGYSFAILFLGLGEKENAMHALERAYRERSGHDLLPDQSRSDAG